MRLGIALFLSAISLNAAGELSNRRAPGFSLPGSDSRQHDTQDYRGKVLIIDTMQTGCEHCRKLSSVLEEAAAKYGGKVAILSIVTMPDTMQKVKQYIDQNNVTTPILFDCGQVMASYLKITAANPTAHFPHIFLVDPDGMIRNDFGYEAGTEQMFESKALFPEIEKLLKK
ncbi:MAG: TlpA family protein disulfide reductase [Acidobacteriota bacterium]|nr:TlpA family protein disulfide reductase [Acidobacteriota bacterium]